MKLFVKQDGGFRYLGEGTIKTKKEFVLKEFDTTSNATDVESLAKDAQKNSHVPGASGIEVQGDQINGRNDGNGEGMTTVVDAPNGNLDANQKNNIRKAAQQNPDGKIKINTQTTTEEGKVFTKRLIEMKRNAVPFSKKELNNYLKNL